MWTRRIDLNIAEPAAQPAPLRRRLKMFPERVRCIPQAADELKATARDKIAWHRQAGGGKLSSAGNKLSMADVFSSPCSTS